MVFITLAALARRVKLHLEAYVKELTSYGLAARAGMGQPSQGC